MNPPLHFNKYADLVQKIEHEHSAIVDVNLSKFIAFHKRQTFKDEKEIRIIAEYPFNDGGDKINFSKVDFKLDDRPRIGEYVELPLWSEKDSGFKFALSLKANPDMNHYFATKPMIKIENILFGFNCGLDNYSFSHYRERLRESILFNYDYHIRNLNLNLFRPGDDISFLFDPHY